MFTGLIEEKGTLVARAPRGPGARLSILCAFGPLTLGESIAVDGVCLTVDRVLSTERGRSGFEADASAETLRRTTLGTVPIGGAVNLERALQAGGRLGGHIVSGHVDGTGRLVAREPLGDAVSMGFAMPLELARYVAEKGSICVNGVSLTVNRVEGTRFDVVCIPRTLADTTLGGLTVGATVNLEVDLLARYLERLLTARGGGADASSEEAWMERLRRAGMA
jgi:riboflavin synthase